MCVEHIINENLFQNKFCGGDGFAIAALLTLSF